MTKVVIDTLKMVQIDDHHPYRHIPTVRSMDLPIEGFLHKTPVKQACDLINNCLKVKIFSQIQIGILSTI